MVGDFSGTLDRRARATPNEAAAVLASIAQLRSTDARRGLQEDMDAIDEAEGSPPSRNDGGDVYEAHAWTDDMDDQPFVPIADEAAALEVAASLRVRALGASGTWPTLLVDASTFLAPRVLSLEMGGATGTIQNAHPVTIDICLYVCLIISVPVVGNQQHASKHERLNRR